MKRLMMTILSVNILLFSVVLVYGAYDTDEEIKNYEKSVYDVAWDKIYEMPGSYIPKKITDAFMAVQNTISEKKNDLLTFIGMKEIDEADSEDPEDISLASKISNNSRTAEKVLKGIDTRTQEQKDFENSDAYKKYEELIGKKANTKVDIQLNQYADMNSGFDQSIAQYNAKFKTKYEVVKKKEEDEERKKIEKKEELARQERERQKKLEEEQTRKYTDDDTKSSSGNNDYVLYYFIYPGVGCSGDSTYEGAKRKMREYDINVEIKTKKFKSQDEAVRWINKQCR